jgi:membrane fusion protein (multidrug efflux system)
MNAPSPSQNTLQAETPRKNGKRRTLLILFTLVVLVALAAYGTWWFIYARHYESTDDAYVAGNVVQVTPQVGGTVTAIHADDTERVEAGKPLIELDPSDAKVALAQAEAQLAQAVRETRTLFVTTGALTANIALRSTQLARARDDLKRRSSLIGTGAVSGEDIEHARNAVKAAESALQAAREQLASNQALTSSTPVAENPNVLRAASQVRAAYLTYARMTLPAPISGYVARRSVQVGQRVAPGAPLLSIVPLNSLWVDANFKEVQLAHMRMNQPVTLHSDLYGSDVVYHGRVVGMAAGTGAAFALLPSQNASGNWIKVVQRVPVRIALDPRELAERPLRIGLSMQVKVDIARDDGTSLTGGAARTAPAYETRVFEAADRDADAEIARIIAANSAVNGAANSAAGNGASSATAPKQ